MSQHIGVKVNEVFTDSSNVLELC